MDLTQAAQAHAEWKVKLRMAIAKKEQMDVRTVSADNCCPLGQWLHGEAKTRWSQLPAYKDVVTKHAAFHREAGAVATAINQGLYSKAEGMLGAGTPYANATSAVGSAILGLKKEVGSTV